MVEAYALCWGIKLAVDSRFRLLHLEGDCLPVNNALDKGCETLSYISSLIGDANKYLESCCAWICFFVHGEGNSVAHKLAKFACNIDNLIS